MKIIKERHCPEIMQKEILDKLLDTKGFPYYEMLKEISVFSPRTSIARFLSHYELFKRIIDIPGIIIDLGVFRGGSSFTFSKLVEIFCPTDVKKKIYGFDTFEGFPYIHKLDGDMDNIVDKKIGGYNTNIENILQLLNTAKDIMNIDRHLNHIERLEFIKGNAIETIPEFCRNYGNGLKIALLNLDFDLYEPTKIALEYFEPLMSTGGIIILDEYADNNWGGETKAVDEYFIKKYGKKPNVKKFPWHSNPSGYIVV
jgi:hypothetical protein